MLTGRNTDLEIRAQSLFCAFARLNFNIPVLFAKQWRQSVTKVCAELDLEDKQNSAVHYGMMLSLRGCAVQ